MHALDVARRSVEMGGQRQEQFIRAVPHTPQGYQSHAEVCAAIQDQDSDRSQEAMQSLIDASATYIQFLHSDNGKE